MLKTDLNELPVGAAVLDLDGSILSINDPLQMMLSPSERQGLRQPATSYLLPQDRGWAFDLFAQLAWDETDTVSCCLRIKDHRDSEFWGLVSARLIKTEQQPRRRMLLIIQDMSIEKEMLEELEAARAPAAGSTSDDPPITAR